MAPPIEENVQTGQGSYLTGPANIPGICSYVGHNTQTISFTFSANENGDAVEYAIWFQEVDSSGSVTNEGYLAADGSDNDTVEVWQTIAEWGTVTATGLTAVQYRFKVKAKNEAGVPTEFSDYSGYMAPYLSLDVGPFSPTVSYEVTSGQCKVSGASITGTSKTVTLAFTLTRINSPSTLNNVKIYYSPDGITYGATDLATIPGVITGAVTSLAASASGTAHPVSWSSCLTVGNSFHSVVYLKIVPYDTATGGNAEGFAVATTSIDNRPLGITISESRGFTWDNDATPIIYADMADVSCGEWVYFILQIKDSTGALVAEYSSAEDTNGWSYEADHAGSPGVFTVPTIYGVPAAKLPPNTGMTGNRIKYEFQSSLTAGQTYTWTMAQAEIVHVLP